MSFSSRPSFSAFLLFIPTLIFTPLAFATVEIWSYTFTQILIFTGLFLYFTAIVIKKEQQWSRTPGLIWLLLFCLYVLFQSVALPHDVIAILSPSTWLIYKKTIWAVSADRWMPISVNRQATLIEFFRISSSVAFYILTIQLLVNKKRITATMLTVCCVTAVIAFLAIIQKFTSPGLIYWTRAMEGRNPIGPWVNRNHYAGFMAMALPVILALFLYYRPKIRYKTSWRQRVQLLLALPESNVHFLLALTAVLVAVSIFLSLSRGGIICMSLGLIIFIFLIAKKKYGSKNIVLLSLIVLTIIVGVSWFGWQPIIDRFEKTINTEGQVTDQRLDIWQDTSKIIQDFPVTGTGFGSFTDIYRGYRTIPGRAIISHAHNDYLELLTDGGAVAAILTLFFFISLFRYTLQRIRKRKDQYCILLFYGSCAGVAALLFHSLTDFNLHIGANLYYFSFYCGLMVAATTTRRHTNSHNRCLTTLGRLPAGLGAAFSLLLLITTISFQSGRLHGQYLFAGISNVFLYQGMKPRRLHTIEQTARMAIKNDPLEARYWSAQANIAAFAKNNNTIPDTIRAVELLPLACNSLQQLARRMASVDIKLANNLFSASQEFNRQKADCIDNYVEWLFKQKNRVQALKTLHDALELDPDAAYYYFPTMQRNKVTVDEIPLALPQDPYIYIKYADIYWQKGSRRTALAVYEKGLEYLNGATTIKPWYFSKGYNWFQKTNQEYKALAILSLGVQMLPDNAGLRERLGDHYRQEKIFFRAAEEYRKALTLEPTQLRVKNKLDNIAKQIENYK